MTVGHNRWHEKIVCCLDMLILRPYIKWRVWPWILWYTSQAWEQWPQHQIYHAQIYLICSTRPTQGFEFWIQSSLDGIKFQIFVYTREMIDGNAEKLCLVSSQVCSVSGANELLMGWVCLAPGDRQETGDCPRHGHQWSQTHDVGWHAMTWTECYQALSIVLCQLHWVWWPLIGPITANNAAPHIMLNFESPIRRLKLR